MVRYCEENTAGIINKKIKGFVIPPVNGKVNISNNPNGSVNNIAGIVNKKKNIMGLMPHPERAFDTFSSRDGKIFFDCLKDLL